MANLIGGFDSPNSQTADLLKNEIIHTILANGLQISKEALTLLLKNPTPKELCSSLIVQLKEKNGFLILPKHLNADTQPPQAQLIPLQNKTSGVGNLSPLSILTNYTQTAPLRGIKDIADYFAARFVQYKKYLQPRLANLQSISNVAKLNNEKISIIGLVSDKRKTKKNNIILELEDTTGIAKVIITKSELLDQAEDILFDEVLGVSGSASRGVLFADELIQPEIPVKREEKHTNEKVYAAFLSDTHIGSNKFLYDKFNSMLSFFSGKGSDPAFYERQQELIENLKYVFVAGDLVDGIGVYPSQQSELDIKDIYTQYKAAANLFAKFPGNIKIIICPGNHDYVRQAQPQPPIEKEVAAELYELPNVVCVSSPSVVSISPFDNGGLKVLLYHGTSIDTIVPMSTKLKDGYKHPEKVMLALLKKRHLSPQYESGIVTPGAGQLDPLQIPEDIDIIHTGHVHSNGALNYRGVTLINSGTWQGTTDFQKLLGHEPTPGRLPMLNLKTRQLKILEF